MNKKLSTYFKIWTRLTISSFQIALISRLGAMIFIIAKTLRFLLQLLVLWLIVTKTKSLAGYTLNETFVFFMTFNLIDTMTQLLFRDVYRFRQKIISGDFDFHLIQPTNSLFRVLLGGADPLDMVMFFPYVGMLIFFLTQISFTPLSFVVFCILCINGLFIGAAFHIVVLALGILTTEIDHAIMIYRDITGMGRFPIDIYHEPLRSIITFVIPVGMMMSFPVKALLHDLSWKIIAWSTLFGSGFFVASLYLWKKALRFYTSASS